MTIIINISTIHLSVPTEFLQIKLTFYNHRIKISFLRLWEYFEVDDDIFKVDYVGLRHFLLTLFGDLVVALKKFLYDDSVLQQWYLLFIWKEVFIHICYVNIFIRESSLMSIAFNLPNLKSHILWLAINKRYAILFRHIL